MPDLVPKLIWERRRTEGLNQLDLAEKLGVARNTIIRWEKGQYPPVEAHRNLPAKHLGGLPAQYEWSEDDYEYRDRRAENHRKVQRLRRSLENGPNSYTQNGGTRMDKMPKPPFPDPDNVTLKMIFDEASVKLDQGLDARRVVVDAAVDAWMEGHIEGHDCSGDEGEPGDPDFRRAVREGRLEDAEAIARAKGIDVDLTSYFEVGEDGVL
jgi:transcriptional regulator with XRE-family HTH domain